MKNQRRIMGLLVIVVFMATSIVFSQVATKGKIQGKVIDQTTKEPLIGAVVQVVEQPMLGAVTNADGEYFIINVPVGKYSLKATFIGYRGVITQNVEVSAGFNTVLNFGLPSESVELNEVVVQAERPLIQRDQTNATSVMKGDEIRNLPLRGVEGAVSIQTGVVAGRGTGNNVFYTRGGRANETMLFVDGFEQNNLLTGAATVSINQSAIEEVQTQTGGFNAEYGRALSGVINVVTKEASPKYSATLETETDFFMGKQSRGYNIYNLAVNGPLIPGYEPLTIFLAAELRNLATAKATQGEVGNVIRGGKMQSWDKGYLPNDRNDEYVVQGKLSYRLASTARLAFNLLHSSSESQLYRDTWKYNLDHAPWTKDANTTVSALLTYTFNASTYTEIGGAFFDTRNHSGDGVFRDNLNAYKAVGLNNPRYLYDPVNGGFIIPEGWEKYQGYAADTTGMGEYLNANGYSNNFISASRYDPYGLYYAPGYAVGVFQTYHAQYYNPKFTVVSQVDAHNQIKVGGEYRYHSLSYYQNTAPYKGAGAELINAYGYTLDGKENEKGAGGILDGARHPWDIALYAQDKIESDGLVVNLGFRFDFFNANTKTLKDEKDPLGANQVPSGDPRQRTADPTDFADTKTESQISPRLGVAFPVTDQTVFHFNYGKFFQQSNLTDLYYGTRYIEYKAYNGSPAVSVQNPNLKPEETVSYEIGLTTQIGGNMRLGVSAYYKDIKNLTNILYTPTTAPGGAALLLVTNLDYGTTKGVDLSFEARQLGMLSGRIAYSLAFAEGTGSTSRENFNAAWLGFSTAKFVQPLQFDQRHTISVNLDLRKEENDGGLFDNAGANILFAARSGFPYTPTKKFDAVFANISGGVPKDAPIGSVNSEYGPWNFSIDAKLDKEFDFGFGTVDIYLRVLNLLNTKNPTAVYQGTGDPYSDGYLGTKEGAFQTNLYDTDNKTYTTGDDFTKRYNDRLNGADLVLNGATARKHDNPREVRLGVIIGL